MAELIKVNKKVINDPLYTPVIAFLKDRIATLEVTGPAAELALSKQRYNGLVAGDLIIESAIRFPDDVVRVCIISRKTGFARVDIDIKYATMEKIVDDFGLPLVEIDDPDHLKTYVKGLVEPIQPTLLYLKDQATYGVLVTQDQATTHAGPMTAFGELFFESYVTERESLNSIDWETLQCGKLTITDPSFGQGVYPLFVYELVLSEAQLPEITSNLPDNITSRRGQTFQIPNTYTFAGTQDITSVATVELSTESGYAILDRSSDLLQIDGETIYGSSDKDVTDTIVVRVTYDWNGRQVHKNFRISLLIEKDLPNDLTVTSTPSEVTATNGDLIEVSLVASYKGQKVEILIPPSKLMSQKGFGNLSYVKTNKDLSMVYRGTVNPSWPTGQDKVTDLWSGEFSFSDNGTIVKATGYVNSILVKPEALPKFEVTAVPSLLEGYKGDSGTYKPVVKYGQQVIPLDQVTISTGPQGSKSLVSITGVTSTDVSWELINDSGNPGQAIRDTFTQTYSWLDPRGVVQSQSFTITVNVKLNSIIRVIQGASKRVKRYTFGGATWTLEVNGVASNGLIRSLALDNPASEGGVNYIINRTQPANQWIVINADKNNEHTLTGKFTFTAFIDDKIQTFKVDQEFVVEKLVIQPDGNNTNPPAVTPADPSDPNEQGTGPGGNEGPDDPTAPGGSQNPNSPGTGDGPYNSELTAVPMSYTMAGNSDRDYRLAFKVYKGTDDVTSQSEIINDATVEPDYVTFKSIAYDAPSDTFIASYTKDKGGVSHGAIFAKLKSESAPAKTAIARVWLNVNVVQIKILKVINPQSSLAININESADVGFNVEFSGVKLALNDPNLTITKTTATSTQITNVGTDKLTVLNSTWDYVGRTANESTTLRFTYTDPADSKVYTKDIPFTFAVTYPPMTVVYGGARELDVSIWDTGAFPVTLKAGDTDFTSSITKTELVSGNKYVNLSGLNWEVYFAESNKISQIVGFNLTYTVGKTTATLPADFKFNIAAWDGITFASTKHSPDTITANSGDTGEITASFVFKGKDATEHTQLNTALSTIPNTIQLGTVSYDAAKGLVIPYTTKLGGDGQMTLIFSAPGSPSITTKIVIDTKITWPHDLNIEKSGSDVSGYWNDSYSYPLVLNFAGTPVPLTDANLALTFNSGADNPIKLTDTQDKSLTLLLAKGGTVATTYNYTITIDLAYTDQTDSKVYSKQIVIPGAIRVPEVRVGSNPTVAGNVFDHGTIPVTLVDERGKAIPIEVFDVSGAGSNVTFLTPDQWYITNGSATAPSLGQLPLRLTYEMGGSTLTLDVTENFSINQWDGTYLSAKPSSPSIDGKGGDTGTIPFDVKYKGFTSPNATIDKTRSKIPDNILISEMNADNTLPYTLAGNDQTKMTLCVVRAGAVEPMKLGTDYVLVDFDVKTASSNLPFTLVSNDDSINLDWGKTGTINFVVKYGDKTIPSNAPGLSIKLANADVHGITIVSQSKDGVVVKATRSNIPAATKSYAELFNISYEVGAPDPKTASFTANAVISMGPVTLTNNTEINAVIWSTGSFQQKVQFNGIDLNTVDHFELQNPDNKYIEVTQPRGYEVVGAETATSTQSIPMSLFYKVDESADLQKLDFNAKFTIPGSTSVRFKVNVNPASIEGSLNNESTVTCTPIYKDKFVGGAATFKPGLSTIPPQLTLKDYKVVGNDYVITFVGAKAGLAELDLVFWSPGAGTNPKPADTYTAILNVKVMGELGLEMGTRDNLITGKNADTGNYRFQVLFGGIPIDVAAEITNGNLTATREQGADTSNNANVTNISQWNKDSFDYTLGGCVQPNATVNVSDFINLAYKYGGQTYTRRVEVPLSYTSSAPTFTGWPGTPVTVFSKGNLNPVANCDGVNITTGVNSIANFGDTDDVYITLGGQDKTYEVIWGEKAQIVHKVSARIIGQYRVWPWSVELTIPFTIAAWDQKTWKPTFSITKWEPYLDLSGKATIRGSLTALYKGVNYAFTANTSHFDSNDSDLKGLVTVTYINGSNPDTQTYELNSVTTGKQTANLAWRRKDSAVPGELDKDYGITPVDLNIQQNSLKGASAGLSGGNGDTVTGPLTVSLLSTGTQIQNINTNLVIKTVDESVMKITSLAASTITVQITAPYTQADGPVTVPMTFTYTDPNTGYVTNGTFDYPVTLKRPADWPVVTQSVPTSTVAKLYDYGPNPFKITVNGNDVSSQVVPTSCVDDGVSNDGTTSNYMQLSLDQPVTGTWWWVTKKNISSSQQSRTTKWKLTVPYRGSTVSVDGTFTYIRAGDGANPPAEFQGSTTASKTLVQNVGDQLELPFKLLWRNYKYSQGVFKPDLTGDGTNKFTDYFKVISQRYDDTDGTTYLKVELTQVYKGSMAFIWDRVDASASPTVGTDRASVAVSFYNLTITDLANSSWNMWDRKGFSTLMNIKDDTTDITSQCKVTAISNSILTLTNPTAANPTVRAASDIATNAFNGNVTYSVQLPAAYNNRVITVVIPTTIAAYDGVELTWRIQSYSNTLVPANTTQRVAPYYTMVYRGQNVVLADRSSSTALLQAANGNNADLVFDSMGIVTPSNWIYYSFTSKSQLLGKVRLPVRYTGTVEKTYPQDTEGKNIVYIEIDVRIYENKLYIYPDDTVPSQVSGSFNDTVPVPVQFSVGKNVDGNIRNANASGMTLSIQGSTVAGLVSIPSSNGTTATGVNLHIDYDNRNDDIVLDVPIRANINSTLNSYAINDNRDWTQKVLIKGTKQGDTTTASNVTSPSASVWDVGAMPFSIVNNGVTVPTSKYKSVTIDDNGYVRTPVTSPSFTSRAWEVYNGDTAASQKTVKFTVVFNDGYKDITFVQNVIFNIAAYDGKDLKITMRNLSTFNNGIVAVVGGNANAIDFTGTYRGVVLNGGSDFDPTNGRFKVWPAASNVPAFNLTTPAAITQGSTGSPLYYYQRLTYTATGADMDSSKDGYIVFGLRSKENDPTAVEGKDFVKVPMPYYVYLANRVYVSSYDSTISGKYGNGTSTGATIRLNYSIRRGLTTVQNNTGGTALVDPAILGISGDSNVGFEPVWFLKELTSAPQKTTRVKFTVNPTADVSLQSSFSVDVTQISTGNFPTVSNLNTVQTGINGGGGLPFKLTDANGNDVTSQATITAISTNDYIRLDSGKWYCYNARTGDTSTKVTFTYSINYNNQNMIIDQDVDFLIKAYDGSYTVSNVQVVNAKVWDTGKTLPFTINVNGNPIPASWIKTVQGSSANGRVTVIDTTTVWKVVAGDTTKAVSDTLSYVVTIMAGNTSVTVNQDIVFNIAQYDGVEFVLALDKLEVGNTQMPNAGAVQLRWSSGQGIYFSGKYRGDPVTNLQQTQLNAGYPMQINGPLRQGSQIVYSVSANDAGISPQTLYFGIQASRGPLNGATPVDGVNVASIVVPIFLIGSGTTFYGNKTTTSIGGKYGDQMPVTLQVALGTTPSAMKFEDLLADNATFTFSPNIIEVVPGSLTATGFKVRFKADVTADTTTTVQVSGTAGSLKPVWNMTVKQGAGQPSVTATGTMNAIKVGETGQVVLTGKVGADALAGKVTFDPSKSDGKNLVTFGTPTTGNDGTVIIPVTGTAPGSANLSIYIKVNGTTGNVSGKDYLNVSVPATVNYGTLTPSDNFQSSATGDANAPVTLTQSVILPS